MNYDYGKFRSACVKPTLTYGRLIGPVTGYGNAGYRLATKNATATDTLYGYTKPGGISVLSRNRNLGSLSFIRL